MIDRKGRKQRGSRARMAEPTSRERAPERGGKVAPNACIQCRKVKMRCLKSPESSKCERCLRKSFECEFRRHRRGRKPGHRSNLSSNPNSDVTEGPANADRPSNELHNQEAVTLLNPRTSRNYNAPNSNGGENTLDLSQQRRSSPSDEQERSSQEFWTQSTGFQPSDILNRQAMKGKFSLQNVLSTTHEEQPEDLQQQLSADDPIVRGLVNLHIAASLFEGFMKHFNPFISQLDPVLHTFDYVRINSSFLFSTVLAAASKSLHPSLYPTLYLHAEDLLINSFRHGWKSVEVVQAILILTYWKKPDDSRAWLSVGYAIRMAMELGWHKLYRDEPEKVRDIPELEVRKRRNLERTWLVLFVYDRSISLQTGKPWMIERSTFIESANDWYKDLFSIANDRLLSAFVTLRLITSSHFETMNSFGIENQRDKTLQSRSLLRLLDRQIEDWQCRWREVVAEEGEACHSFLVPFYGSYAKLLLFTSPLRASLDLKDIESSVDTEAIWNSCSSALEMLRLVCHTSISPQLYFAQDSVHIMIAYATVFLIKFLVSAPDFIRNEMELAVMDAIRNAAQVFSDQGAPVNTGCGLQARFFDNVICEYENIDRRRRRRKERGSHQRSGASGVSHNPTLPAPQILPVEAPEMSLTQAMGAHVSQATGGGIGNALHYDSTFSNSDTSPQSSMQEFGFADDEAWATIFANAGFSIDQGAFLPNI